MTIQTFLGLLAVLMTVNSLLTQAVKMVLDDRKQSYSSNIVALIDSVAIGICGMAIYYHYSGTAYDPIMMILMAMAVWLSSMGLYDKVTQAIKQIGGNSNGI